jgi:MFS family permease
MPAAAASPREGNPLTVALLYLSGVVQGLSLVTFPAASAIFTSPTGFGFSGGAYGGMFVPQVVLAIGAAAGGRLLTRRLGLRGVLLLGLTADFASMLLLALSPTLAGSQLAYPLLLLATGALGLGFGATVPTLNTAVESQFPAKADGAVLALNALLGVGTALAPALVALCTALGAWWMLPLVMGTLIALLVVAFAVLRPELDGAVRSASAPGRVPPRVWLYRTAVLLYGIVETLAGNWAVLFLETERHIATGTATFALTAFWSATTLGRLLFAGLGAILPARWVYVGLSLLLALVFELVPHLDGAALGIAGFALAGFACSALLPLSISLGGAEFPKRSVILAGELIAFYQVGYGIAAFGVGPLHDNAGYTYASLYALGGGIAVALTIVGYVIARRPLQSAG